MIRALKRWLEKRAAEKARRAYCKEAREKGEALVRMVMAGRVPVNDDDEFFRNLEADIFHEECGDR